MFGVVGKDPVGMARFNAEDESQKYVQQRGRGIVLDDS